MTTACWTLAWALLVWFVFSPAAAQQAPPAADETNFAAGFMHGCMKGKQSGGVEERHLRARCVCTVHEFRAALSDSEFREMVTRGTMTDDLLPRLATAQIACTTVGTYDRTAADPPETELLPARRFENFSIRLPQGFIPLKRTDHGKPAYEFFRPHADLDSSAVVSIRILPTADTGFKPGGTRSAAIAWHVVAMMKSLKQRGATIVPTADADMSIGSLTLQGIQFTSSKDGRDARGFAYVTVVQDKALILVIQDTTANATVTLPLMQESLKTFVFHGEGR